MTDFEQQYEPGKKLGLNDFLRGFGESSLLYLVNKNARNGTGFAVITGLIAAFPEKLNFKTLQRTPEYKQLVAVAYLATQVNDYIDMQHVPDESLKEEIETEWTNILKGIGFNETLPEDKTNLIKSYIAGVDLVNNFANHDSDKSFKATLHYKELENAVSLVHMAGMALGMKDIGQEAFDIDNLKLEELEKKYEWILKGHPVNEVQRRLCGLFNLVMMTQIIDDSQDKIKDKELGIRNLQNDADTANESISYCVNKYFQNASGFGVTNRAFTGNKIFMEQYKIFQIKHPNLWSGRRERLLK